MSTLSLCAKKLCDQLFWGSFTLDELRHIFDIQNEPVFQRAIGELVRLNLVELVTLNDERALNKK